MSMKHGLMVWTVVLLSASGAVASPQVYEPGDTGLGFNLVSWWNAGSEGEAIWEGAIADLYDHGHTHVSICPVRFFDKNTGAIATTSAKGPELSHIAAGVAKAKSLGMTVTVNPFVEYENFETWRGYWNPSGAVATQFWADYEQYVSDMATVAQANGADRMTIGTELRAIVRNSAHNAAVSSVIDAVDAAFSGDIGYAANHDTYNNSNVTSNIWENSKVDFIGVDAYFNLASDAQADGSGAHPDAPFISTVESNWNSLLDGSILPFADQRKGGSGMPVILTEHGLIPYNRTTVAPYSENPGYTQPLDQDEQINGYDAMLRSLDGRADADDLLEVYLWHWGMRGAHDSFWFLNPNAEDNEPGSKYDETLGIPAAKFLSLFALSAYEPGDLDRDGVVSFVEAATVVANVGMSGARWSDGDLDLDGVVELVEAEAVVAGYEAGSGTSFAMVPEPAAVGLLAWGWIGLTSRRRRRGCDSRPRP